MTVQKNVCSNGKAIIGLSERIGMHDTHSSIHPSIHSEACLLTVHSPFYSQFSTQYAVLFPLSLDRNFLFPYFIQQMFFLLLPSLIPFPKSFLQQCVSEDSSYATFDQYASFTVLLFIGHSYIRLLSVTLAHFSHDQSN